jgi:leishmanolysin-like peptidase
MDDHERDALEHAHAEGDHSGCTHGPGGHAVPEPGHTHAQHDASRATQPHRHLQQQQRYTPPPARPIRMGFVYQRMDALDAGQQATLTRVVAAVSRVLAKFISVKAPPAGGLLADPYCLRYGPRSGCTLYYPSFAPGAEPGDAQCGLAALLPSHIVDPGSCASRAPFASVLSLSSAANATASGAGGGRSAYGSGCGSFSGGQGDAVDLYMYLTAVQVGP